MNEIVLIKQMDEYARVLDTMTKCITVKKIKYATILVKFCTLINCAVEYNIQEN